MELGWKGFVLVLTFTFQLYSSTPCSYLLSCEPTKAEPLSFWLQSRRMTALKLSICLIPIDSRFILLSKANALTFVLSPVTIPLQAVYPLYPYEQLLIAILHMSKF